MATNEDTKKQQAERYRRAAEQTLDQLDWCVSCIVGIVLMLVWSLWLG